MAEDPPHPSTGDDFRRALHRAADLVADYLEDVERYPVMPPIRPGAVAAELPAAPPVDGEPWDALLDDYRRIVEPNVTHWNHPGFLAWFSSTGSEPGILGELLAAGLSVNAMLWRTSPAATELEERVADWVRQMLGLPAEFRGHVNDTASSSTLLALAAARDHRGELAVRERGLAGRDDLPAMVVYASDQAHSSIDKAMIALGLGLGSLRRLPTDDAFRLDPAALEAAIDADRAAGRLPIAVVATVGTTSTTSADPVAAIAEVARAADLWLHVDAAWAGAAALCPELREPFRGWEEADSVVFNPHKWLFVPMDCSLLYLRDPDRLRAAFSLVPEYLRTDDDATNLMDYGFQLGRRFRALKLWMVIRSFGVGGLQAVIRRHVAWGRAFADRVDADPRFERLAPVPFSTVCFRAVVPRTDVPGADDATLDALNDRVLAAVNAAGPVLLSATKLHGRTTLRVAVSNLRTREEDLERAWRLLSDAVDRETRALDAAP